MNFEPGDVQWINNHVVLHSRTDYEDFEEPERKRHLLRLWVASPDAPALPDAWALAYKDVAARARCAGASAASTSRPRSKPSNAAWPMNTTWVSHLCRPRTAEPGATA